MKVLVSDKLAPEGLEILKKAPGLTVDYKTGMKPEELLAIIGEYDALAIRSATKATKEIVEAGKNLRVIGRAGIGVDNVDVPTATKKGIVVMNTPGGNAVTTAEHALSLMMSLARKIPQAYHSMKEKKWEKSKFTGVEVMDKTLGVVGLGNIGKIAADRALGLKMKVIAYDPFVTPEVAARMGVEMVSLDELYARADFITLHVPKTEETKGMINAATFAKMKNGVRIINASRGGIVVEKDLIEAIKSKKVAGAALDVFEKEPPEFTGELWDLDEVIFTPHLGASTGEALVNVSVGIAQQIVDYLQNGIITNAINFPSVSKELIAILSPYTNLAERMGRLAGQLVSSFHGVEIYYNGDMADLNTKPITHAALKGLLETIKDEPINYVSAPAVAKAKGITVKEMQSRESGEFKSMIRLVVKDGSQEIGDISGTIFGKNDPRIVQIGKVSMDASPNGYVLILRNHDKPGVIGNVGSLLARHGINIARFQLGREAGEALCMVNVDQAVPDAVLEEIGKLPNIISVKQVNLG